MAKCPKCGKETTKSTKELKNYLFSIKEYTCKKCQHRFVTNK